VFSKRFSVASVQLARSWCARRGSVGEGQVGRQPRHDWEVRGDLPSYMEGNVTRNSCWPAALVGEL
jgi:hypothetical protein